MALLVLAFAQYASARGRSQAAPAPIFDVAAFFSGRTEGEGRLKVVMRKTRAVLVHGTGKVDSLGRLRLTQIVNEQGKPASNRTWMIVATGNGHYAGSLTGTTAAIRGLVVGNCLHLWLKLKGGLIAEQLLYLQPGGRTALNHMTIRKLGVRVATLEETITKID